MTPRNRKGFTLADVILILIVVAIMAVAGMSFYISLLGQHRGVTQHMTGISLATAQIEDLMAMDYIVFALSAGSPLPATVAMPPSGGYTLSYSVIDNTGTGPLAGMVYKSITVIVTTPGPISRTIQLTGYKPAP